MRHLFKSRYGQCSCRWCGKGSPISDGECQVSAEVREAVMAFAAQHGCRWKSRLRHLWLTSGPDDIGPIRLARNLIGPSGLDRIGPWELAHLARKNNILSPYYPSGYD